MLLDHIFLDTETGGTDPVNDTIISLAAIRSDSTGKVLASFYEHIEPKGPVHEGAAKVNGYDQATWRGLPLDYVMHKFQQVIITPYERDKVIFVGHFADFDRVIVRENCRRSNIEVPLRTRMWIDTCTLAWPFLFTTQVQNLKLIDLCKFFGIEYVQHHDAMSDVKACYDLYWELMRRYSVVLMVHDAANSRAGGILKAVEGLVTGIRPRT